MPQKQGKIIVAPDVNVWPHEMDTARALAKAGLTVKFIRRSEEQRTTSADVTIGGIDWEIKSPRSGKARMIEQNLRRALRQSSSVVFDSRRMKGVPDAVVERELRKCGAELKSLKRLIMVDRHGKIIESSGDVISFRQ